MTSIRATIRSMSADDWDAFYQIDQDIFPEDMMREVTFRERVEAEGFFALETNDGKLAGYLIVSRFGESGGHLGRIGVARAFQRQGLGTQLMRRAIEWFKAQGDITHAYLYTQHDNHPAQSLYKRFGFKVVGTTWHYFVPFDTIKPTHKYTCQPILPEEIERVGAQYEANLPAASIRRFLEREFLILTLKDKEGRIVGACRYSPKFPGCFPFEIDDVEYFDYFIQGLRAYS